MPTILQSANAGADVSTGVVSKAATFSSAVTVGSSILVITLSRFPIATVTDSKGNTYVRDAQKLASGANISIWRSKAVGTGGSSFTVTATDGTTPGVMAIAIVELSGAIDFVSSASGGATNAAPTLTVTASASSYVLSAFNAGPTTTAVTGHPAGWQSRVLSSFGQTAEAMDNAYSAEQSVTTTWGLSAARTWISLAGVYIGAPTPPATPVPLLDQPGPHWPPIPGSPWLLMTMRPAPFIPPTAVEVATTRPQQLLVPVVSDVPSQAARQARADRLASLVLNSLLRRGIIHRTGENSFVIRAGGYSATRSPGDDDDATLGFIVGTAWVDNSESPARLWLCAGNTVGDAEWVELQSADEVGTSGGASGTFP